MAGLLTGCQESGQQGQLSQTGYSSPIYRPLNLQNVTNLKDCRPKAVTSSRHANLVQLSAMPLPKAGSADAQRK